MDIQPGESTHKSAKLETKHGETEVEFDNIDYEVTDENLNQAVFDEVLLSFQECKAELEDHTLDLVTADYDEHVITGDYTSKTYKVLKSIVKLAPCTNKAVSNYTGMDNIPAATNRLINLKLVKYLYKRKDDKGRYVYVIFPTPRGIKEVLHMEGHPNPYEFGIFQEGTDERADVNDRAGLHGLGELLEERTEEDDEEEEEKIFS